MPKVQTGLEKMKTIPPSRIPETRLGLLCNPASVDSRFRHARRIIAEIFPGRLKALYSPQHGFFGEKQDNMIESDHLMEPELNIPVFSLYGQTRIPTKEMFDPIDALMVDLQDAGTRVYTFVYTLSYCMEAARKFGKKVYILDRPNPVSGVAVEGNPLNPDYASFVGRYPIPMRHGMTIGELGMLFNRHFGIACDLTVIPLEGWRREMYFTDTGLPWAAPSPNLPTPVSAMVYPGQVLWEGTNISEGRGTTQPFEIFGAPFLDTRNILSKFGGTPDGIPGIILRELSFEPTFNKWKQTLCRGFQLHVTSPQDYKPYRTTLKLISAILSIHREAFEWKSPPYEYETEKLPIDLITGEPAIREMIENGEKIEDIEATWHPALRDFETLRKDFLLYE